MIPVKIIGLGMEPHDLTTRIVDTINQAEVLAGGERHLNYFPNFSGQRLPLTGNLKTWLEDISEKAKTKSVAILASGDPGHYGIAAGVIEKLGAENVTIYPNITAVQAAFASLKMPWTNAAVISLHGRDETALLNALTENNTIAVYTDPRHTPGMIAELLINRGQKNWKMHVLEDLGQESERARLFSLEAARQAVFSNLNVVVLIKTLETERLTLGTPDAQFAHENGLITKKEVRAVALSSLNLAPDHTLWDLGAGCGSVGLEASLLLSKGRIISVEKNPARIKDIKTNREKFGVAILEVFQMELPVGLDTLPDPDRVFIGGGGKNIEKIITGSAARLKDNGIILVSAVMADSIELSRKRLEALNFDVDMIQVQINRSEKIGSGVFQRALNPVWLIRGVRKYSGDEK